MKIRFVLAGVAATSMFALAAQAQVPPGQPIPRSDPNGVYCREYTQPVIIGGNHVTSYGQACQQPDGTWRIISNDQAQAAQQTQAPVEYLDEPQYTTPPQYVAAPTAYYYPPPAYYYPEPYYGSSITFGFGSAWPHDHRGWHGGGGHYSGGHGGGGHHH